MLRFSHSICIWEEKDCVASMSRENQEIKCIKSGFIHLCGKYLFITSYAPEWCKRIHKALIKQNWPHPHLQFFEKEFGNMIKLILRPNIHRLKSVYFLCLALLEVKWNSVTWLWLAIASLLNCGPKLLVPKPFTPRQIPFIYPWKCNKSQLGRDSNIFKKNYKYYIQLLSPILRA